MCSFIARDGRNCTKRAEDGGSRCADHKRPHGWGDGGNSHRTNKTNTAEWKRIRAAVLHRDKGVCQLRLAGVCEFVAREVDHIISDADGGRNDLDNLRAACQPCHRKRTSQQGHQAKASGKVKPPALPALRRQAPKPSGPAIPCTIHTNY